MKQIINQDRNSGIREQIISKMLKRLNNGIKKKPRKNYKKNWT